MSHGSFSCGHKTCQQFDSAAPVPGQDYEGPTCVFKALDLGIALGSAAKTASDLNIDNRIMYRAGTAAKRLGYLSGSNVIMGIPISAFGKNICFDRNGRSRKQHLQEGRITPKLAEDSSRVCVRFDGSLTAGPGGHRLGPGQLDNSIIIPDYPDNLNDLGDNPRKEYPGRPPKEAQAAEGRARL